MTLGVALSRYPDIEIAVYEAAGSLKEVGAGVMIWGRTWRVLSLLGLHAPLRELAGVPTDGSGGECTIIITFIESESNETSVQTAPSVMSTVGRTKGSKVTASISLSYLVCPR